MRKFILLAFIGMSTMAFGYCNEYGEDDELDTDISAEEYFAWEEGMACEKTDGFDIASEDIMYGDIWAEIATEDYILALYHLEKKEVKSLEDDMHHDLIKLYISVKMGAKKAIKSSMKRIEMTIGDYAED
ncbi:MAG: hypothetical protein IMZ64_05170 [Bacteroidetes bacterium]|nr:hypothetical protein [Bacteroidota bacterium]